MGEEGIPIIHDTENEKIEDLPHITQWGREYFWGDKRVKRKCL